MDPQGAYTAVKSVVPIPRQAAEEAKASPKVAELRDRLIDAYPRLFSAIANKNPPDHGKFGTAKIKLKPNPKISRHREYQLEGERVEGMKKLLMELMSVVGLNPPMMSVQAWPSAFQKRRRVNRDWLLITGDWTNKPSIIRTRYR